MKEQLIFIYNADGDLFNSLNDFAHKIISPDTYQCSLCALTHGNFAMKREWKNFIKALHVEAVSMYKDEFEKLYTRQINLPAVFIKKDELLIQLIISEEINACKSLQQLKDLVLLKLKQYDQHHHSNI